LAHGLRFIKYKKININELHFQYIPIVYNEKFWAGRKLTIANSPHVRLLKQYKKIGTQWEELWQTDYVKMMEYWNSIGFHKRDKTFIISKMKRFFILYKSIKSKGYQESNCISVLSRPLYVTRYGHEESFLEGYEIWHGHHRAVCCYVVGIKKIKCKLFKDIKPNSKKCRRIDRRLRKIK